MAKVSSCVALALAFGLAVAGCRTDSDEEVCSATEHADLSGTWELTMTVTTDSCDPGDVGQEDYEVIDVVQSGRTLTTEINGVSLRGTVCGDSFSVQGNESGTFLGCVGSESVSASGSLEGEQLSGQSRYSSTTNGHEDCFGIGSCNGGYSFTGQRL